MNWNTRPLNRPMFGFGIALLLLKVICLPLSAAVVYENDFQNVKVGHEPDDFLVLDGAFEVKAEGEERWLELPGAPLDNFGALFGPSRREGSRIQVSVLAKAKRRLAPTFGVGVNGLGGFRLMVSANKQKLELFRGEDLLVSVPFKWQGGGWTEVALEAKAISDSKWVVRGKVWSRGQNEPKDWDIGFQNQPAPPRGKASIWGHPFSGYPIQYDRIVVRTAGNKSED